MVEWVHMLHGLYKPYELVQSDDKLLCIAQMSQYWVVKYETERFESISIYDL